MNFSKLKKLINLSPKKTLAPYEELNVKIFKIVFENKLEERGVVFYLDNSGRQEFMLLSPTTEEMVELFIPNKGFPLTREPGDSFFKMKVEDMQKLSSPFVVTKTTGGQYDLLTLEGEEDFSEGEEEYSLEDEIILKDAPVLSKEEKQNLFSSLEEAVFDLLKDINLFSEKRLKNKNLILIMSAIADNLGLRYNTLMLYQVLLYCKNKREEEAMESRLGYS